MRPSFPPGSTRSPSSTQVEMRRAIRPAFWITTTGPRGPEISILFLLFSSDRRKSAG